MAGEPVYALDPETCVVETKSVEAVSAHSGDGDELVSISTVRSDFTVTPCYPMLVREYSGEPEYIEAGRLDPETKYKFVNSWEYTHNDGVGEVDITRFLDDDQYDVCAEYDCHGHAFRSRLPDGCEKKRANYHYGFFFDGGTFSEYQTEIEEASTRTRLAHPDGGGSTLRPYTFEGDDFIELLGWHITEGNVYYPERSSTAQWKIAQEDETGREKIGALFRRMGLDPSVDAQGFSIGSRIYGELMEQLCGQGSEHKVIPDFVFEEASRNQKAQLFETMLEGDGSAGTYYTNSDQLQDDFARLCVEIGRKPMIKKRRGTWEIKTVSVPDGFTPENVSRRPGDDVVYNVSVEGSRAILAGRNGKFQWVGQAGQW